MSYSRLTVKFQSSIVLIAIVALTVALVAIYKEVSRYSQAHVTLATASLQHSNSAAEQALLEALESKARSIGRLIADASKDMILSYNLRALQQFQNDAISDRDVAFVVFLRKNGKPFLRDSQKELPASKMEVKLPISVGVDTIGYVLVGMNTADLEHKAEVNRDAMNKLIDDVDDVARDAQWSIVKLIVVVTVLLLAATLAQVYYFFRSMILEPVNSLREVAREVQQGNFHAKVEKCPNDELGVLAETFNNMIEALSATTYSKEYIENVLRSMGDMLFVISGSRQITMVNPALLRKTGYEEYDLIGQEFDKIFPDKTTVDEIVGMLTHNNEIVKFDTCYRCKSGALLHVELSGNYLRTSGKMFGIVFAAQDITDRLAARAQLEANNRQLENSNRQLDQFAYVVSHDLKAPLRAIANLSTWLEEDLAQQISGESRKQMDLLRGRVNRMEALINGILEYSRAGRINASLEKVEVAKLLREVIESMPVPPGFTINIGDGMPEFITAKVPLSQVFANLLSNAIKYRASDAGRVDITVEDCGDHFCFSVQDDGPGIAPEFHEKIFVIFQTLAPRDQIESTGVGLSVVKKIVEEQGGRIKVISATGKGANFVFTWKKNLNRAQAA